VFKEFSGTATEENSCVFNEIWYGDGRKVMRVQRGIQSGDGRNAAINEISGTATEENSCVFNEIWYGDGRKTIRVQRDLR
jgi:hypothetical protein